MWFKFAIPNLYHVIFSNDYQEVSILDNNTLQFVDRAVLLHSAAAQRCRGLVICARAPRGPPRFSGATILRSGVGQISSFTFQHPLLSMPQSPKHIILSDLPVSTIAADWQRYNKRLLDR